MKQKRGDSRMSTAHTRLAARAMQRRHGLGRRRMQRLKRVVAYVVLSVGGFAMMLPFFWLLSSSLKRPETIYVFPPQWIPRPAYWVNYVEVFRKAPVGAYAKKLSQKT